MLLEKARYAAMCNVLFKCHRTLPWQMKSTRIIKISYHKKPKNAVFWGIMPTCFFYYKSYILSADFAKYGKTVQFIPLIRSKIVVKIFRIATLDFAPPFGVFLNRGGTSLKSIFFLFHGR